MAITISGDSPSFSSTYQGGVITSGTAVASTSGTAIDFTNIPSWVKRVTVMFNGVSTTGSANIFLQLGTGSTPTYVTTGYNAPYTTFNATTLSTALATTGFSAINPLSGTITASGSMVLNNLTGNTWTAFGSTGETSGTRMIVSTGSIALAAQLTAIRITTTDTFDAGTINILYE